MIDGIRERKAAAAKVAEAKAEETEPDRSPLSPQAQSQMDAFLAKATNLARSSRDVRPLNFPLPLTDTENSSETSATSRSASISPREALPTERYPAAAITKGDIARPEMTPGNTVADESNQLDLYAEGGGHQIVPI